MVHLKLVLLGIQKNAVIYSEKMFPLFLFSFIVFTKNLRVFQLIFFFSHTEINYSNQ